MGIIKLSACIMSFRFFLKLCAFSLFSTSSLADYQPSCDLEGCTTYDYWRVGSATFHNGKSVLIAETPAFHGADDEHTLAFIYTPESCTSPVPYFRFPAPHMAGSYQIPLRGQFRINANHWFNYQAMLYFPNGRVGTGVFQSISPSVDGFTAAVAIGESLDSVSFRQDGSAVHHEYNLKGSKDALRVARELCESVTTEPKTPHIAYQLALPGGHELAASSELIPHPLVETPSPQEDCNDPSFWESPSMASSFSLINQLLATPLGSSLEELGVPYEFVCQDLQSGFTPADLANVLINKVSGMD